MDLEKVLKGHKLWLNGAGGFKANLKGADLKGADLKGADLRKADLRGADLIGADLRGADLKGAGLRGADLRGADLEGADLWWAYLEGADLRRAYLKGAYLEGADLRGADLRWAYLEGADLRGAELNSVVGDMKYIKSGQVEQWPFAYTSDALHIGCKRNSISEWFKFDDTIIAVMDDKALAFWKKWKDWFALTIELSPATPTKDEE